MLGANLWGPPGPDAASEFEAFSAQFPLPSYQRIAREITESGRHLGNTALRASILTAIEARSPASFIRLSDGEGNLLAMARSPMPAPALVAYAIRRISYIHFGDDGVIDTDRTFFQHMILDAVAAAKVVGLPTSGSIENGFSVPDEVKDVRAIFGNRSVLLYAKRLLEEDTMAFADVWFNRGLLPFYREIVRAAKRTCIVSSFSDLPARLACAFDLSDATLQFIPVPMQAVHVPTKMRTDSGHFPHAMREIVKAIPHSDGTTVVLVGAGLLGKHYCTIAKERGSIAIDIGSVPEIWLGIPARALPEHFMARWRLPGPQHT